MIEALQCQGFPVQAFQTTAASKRIIIDALALAFEQGALRLPDVPWLLDELLSYEQERLPGGTLRFGAPPGGHDDGVMALALAIHGAGTYLDFSSIQTIGRGIPVDSGNAGWGSTAGSGATQNW